MRLQLLRSTEKVPSKRKGRREASEQAKANPRTKELGAKVEKASTARVEAKERREKVAKIGFLDNYRAVQREP